MDFELFVGRTLNHAFQNLSEEYYNYLHGFQSFNPGDFKDENLEFIRSISQSNSEYQDYESYIIIQFIISIVKNHQKDLYSSCICQINIIKQREILLNRIESELAQSILNEPDFESPQAFKESFENLQKIDVANQDFNNNYFFGKFNRFLINNRDENIDFIQYIIVYKQFQLDKKPEELEKNFEKLVLALVFMSFNEKNLLSFMKFQKIYLTHFEKSSTIIKEYFESLISMKFKKLLSIPSQKLSTEAEKIVVGQRKVEKNQIQFATRDSEICFFVLMKEILIIEELLHRNKLPRVKSLSFKKVSGKVCAEVILNENLKSLISFFIDTQEINLNQFFTIFSNIVRNLLTFESFSLNFCLHPECVLIDLMTGNCLLFSGSFFCSVPKGADFSSHSVSPDPKITEYPQKVALMMEESLKYLNAQKNEVEELKQIISTIRENSQINLSHIDEYLRSKLVF
jgi:hypothetical protein